MDKITIRQCQDLVNHIFTNLLFQNHYVQVYDAYPIAPTAMVYYTDYPQYPPNAQGVIFININHLQEKDFDLDEIYFILGHESMHIFLNHSFNRGLWNQILESLRGKENDPIKFAITDILRVLSSIFTEKKIPLDIDAIMRDEYAADELAIKWVTKRPDKAISCLTKLVNGDLSQPSHKWEFYGDQRTMMTMEERINKLSNIFKTKI
jgi:hypothetical protein